MNKLNLYLKLPRRFRERILGMTANKSILEVINKKIQINKLYKNDIYVENWGDYDVNRRQWFKALKKISSKTTYGMEETKYFYKDKIDIIKITPIESKVILICLVKDDLDRMKKFIDHYRKIGVKKFAIIDNDSKDGTFEFLKEQEDIDLFQVKEKYLSMRRQSWINRVISYYGYNKWYLIVDSDELLVYNDLEDKNINQLIDYYEEHRIKRCKALMIDMYPKSFIMGKDIEEDYIDVIKYFDTDTYTNRKNKYCECISGGMRARVFRQDDKDFDVFLVKYPLIYFERGDVQSNSHYSFPFYKNFDKPLNMALLHYKFLPKDLERIKEIVQNKNFAKNSIEYQKYLQVFEKDNNMNLLYEGSKEYSSSESIYVIDKLKKIEWK